MSKKTSVLESDPTGTIHADSVLSIGENLDNLSCFLPLVVPFGSTVLEHYMRACIQGWKFVSSGVVTFCNDLVGLG